jgi:hypothetical protein
MKKKEKSQETDNYGKITVSKSLNLLINIIGKSVILDLIPKKNRISYKGKIEKIIYEKKIPYPNVVILQSCCKQFFKDEKEGIENKYKVSQLVMTSLNSILKSFLWDFSLYTKSNIISNKSKNEIALHLLHERAFHYLYDDPSEKDPLTILMNTDSYKKIFDKKTFKDKEKAFYEKEGEGYRNNIRQWQEEIVYNPSWQKLVPVLEFFYNHNRRRFVHRLIGLYLRKNAQEEFRKVLCVSKDELKEIIENIINMIREKKRPEKFPSDLRYNNIWLYDQRIRITKCLEFQNNYENTINLVESNNIIKYLEDNYLRSSEEKFLFFWLQTRAKIIENYSNIKDHKETQKEILNGYKKAFDELLNDIEKSPFLHQFLIEIILINYFLNRRNKKSREDYYEYGCTLEYGFTIENGNIREKLNANEQEKILNNILKEFRNKDIRKTLLDIHSKTCPIEIIPFGFVLKFRPNTLLGDFKIEVQIIHNKSGTSITHNPAP